MIDLFPMYVAIPVFGASYIGMRIVDSLASASSQAYVDALKITYKVKDDRPETVSEHRNRSSRWYPRYLHKHLADLEPYQDRFNHEE